MSTYEQAEQIRQILENAKTVLVIQADNPDGDSLGSALALEHILGDMGKEVHLYCGVDMPGYLRYLPGWDRVQKEIPKRFDASIIVDASTMTLLQKLVESNNTARVASQPVVVLDHHQGVTNDIPFATVTINDFKRSSTGELIFSLAENFNWKVTPEAGAAIMTAILGDTQGLSNDLTSLDTYLVMAELVKLGVDRPLLEEARRAYSKMPKVIFDYKADLIKRTTLHADDRIALVDIPQTEINEFSPLYNPAPLIQNDMLQIEGVLVAIVIKHYDDGKVTAAIRCNPGATIAAELAVHFGGGGHAYASGFKVEDGRPFTQIKSECIEKATGLLDQLKQEKP